MEKLAAFVVAIILSSSSSRFGVDNEDNAARENFRQAEGKLQLGRVEEEGALCYPQRIGRLCNFGFRFFASSTIQLVGVCFRSTALRVVC